MPGVFNAIKGIPSRTWRMANKLYSDVSMTFKGSVPWPYVFMKNDAQAAWLQASAYADEAALGRSFDPDMPKAKRPRVGLRDISAKKVLGAGAGVGILGLGGYEIGSHIDGQEDDLYY